MLNKQGTRELAYVVKIDSIEPIPGRDRVECAKVGGWTIMVRKDQFKPGDLGIYFEIDSKVPAKEPFMFLEGKHFKIKTQKYKTPNGQFWSQGLLMGAEDFNGTLEQDAFGELQIILKINNNYKVFHEKDFLTKELGVTYADPEDNKRKSKSSVDKYQKMAQRMGKKFAKQPYRWLMKKTWGKKLLFFFYGKKKDTKAWPEWVVKTDEERVQNIPWILEDKSEWFATEKIDGTSTTFTMKGWGRKREFFICSRNVCFNTPEKMETGAWYDTNVYQEMGIKYDIENVLATLMEYFDKIGTSAVDFVTLQGETYGAGIQKRDYSLTDHDFMAFNVIVKYEGKAPRRLNPREMTDLLADYGVPCVPIVNEHFVMPDTVDELLAIATDASKVDGGMREGLVFRSVDGAKSFKAVSNEFLMKYHNG